MNHTNTYIISLGSNQGDSLAILRSAGEALEKQAGLQVLKKSSFYRTAPWGKTDQPDFLNAVMEISWGGEPETLLTCLLGIEKQFGRQREIHWGPRTLDLDLIYGGTVTRESAFLRLPHPYFWERSFVLVPLEEIRPDFSFRGTGIHQRIAELNGYKEVEKTEDSWEGNGSCQKK